MLIPSGVAIAQVKINVPGQNFRRQEEIRTTIINIGKQPITLCLVFTSMDSLPLPFAAQRNNGGKWDTLLLGSDLGPNGSALVLEAGESREFPLHLSDSGKMRLMLEYWQGAKPHLSCTPRGSKAVKSAVFTIEEAEQITAAAKSREVGLSECGFSADSHIPISRFSGRGTFTHNSDRASVQLKLHKANPHTQFFCPPFIFLPVDTHLIGN
jgi:hypothetical protein